MSKTACGLSNLQDDASKQQLLLQVLSKEEQLACFLKERSRSLDAKLHLASLWLPSNSATDDSSQLQTQSQQLQQHHQQPQAMDIGHKDSTTHQMLGYVSICGIELPCRAVRSTGDVSPNQQGTLIHTPAVADNMKAAALALCQNRPLLLEGPPGDQFPALTLWVSLLSTVHLTYPRRLTKLAMS